MGVLTQSSRATNIQIFCLTRSKNTFNQENGIQVGQKSQFATQRDRNDQSPAMDQLMCNIKIQNPPVGMLRCKKWSVTLCLLLNHYV